MAFRANTVSSNNRTTATMADTRVERNMQGNSLGLCQIQMVFSPQAIHRRNNLGRLAKLGHLVLCGFVQTHRQHQYRPTAFAGEMRSVLDFAYWHVGLF
jgi:hypothetical protein